MTFHYANNIDCLKDLEEELINAWLEIDLTKYKHNIFYLRSLLPKNTKVMQVVKADAYGHGAIEISEIAEKIGIDFLGVANIAEGKILRENNIKLPILILGSIFDNQIEYAIKHDLQITITSLDSLEHILAIAKDSNKLINSHLKIDTGMGRVGILSTDLELALTKIKESKNIVLKGVMTHFAESEKIASDFTNKQLELFNNCIEKIRAYGFSDFIIHCANSSAVLVQPNSYFNMVRLGISSYGIGDPIDNNLKQIIKLRTRIINIKKLPPNHSIGYRRTFFTKKESFIAILPVGYADGVPRILSNNQDVLINGKRYPICGNISMDQLTVDITNNPEIKIGDEAILLGESQNEKITVEEWANKAYRITYEILCGFGNRLPRKYVYF
ncbi:MAG: alanine racemase [Candidatus Sericytochromatia bacterium]